MIDEVYRGLPRSWRLPRRFRQRLGYAPNFKNPKTFNEKINARKLGWKHSLFPVCSDKCNVKSWVDSILGPGYVIHSIMEGNELGVTELVGMARSHGGVVVKASHNSGPVFVLDQDVDLADAEMCLRDIRNQLEVDFGKNSLETWYSEIEPRMLVEPRLNVQGGGGLDDYKFHVFRREEGQAVVLQVDYDRYAGHHRSFYDESMNWLPFSLQYPCLRTKIEPPPAFERMIDAAKKLAEPFSYVRVDMYNIDGQIRFGEMTFAHGGGFERFSDPCYDLWMGMLWEGDPVL